MFQVLHSYSYLFIHHTHTLKVQDILLLSHEGPAIQHFLLSKARLSDLTMI